MARWHVYQQTFYTYNGTESSRDFVRTIDDTQQQLNQVLSDLFGTTERPAVTYTQPTPDRREARVRWSPINKPGFARDREAPGDYEVLFTAELES